MIKKCSSCKQEKELSNFYKDKTHNKEKNLIKADKVEN